MPPGVSVLRSSDAGYETSTGIVLSVGGSDIGRIATRSGSTGLRIERSTANIVPAGKQRALDTWTTFAGTSVGGATTGPDGTSNAHRVTTPAGGSLYYSYATLIAAGGYGYSAWAKYADPAKTSLQFQIYDGSPHAAVTTIGSAWAQVGARIVTTSTATITITIAEGRDFGFGTVPADAYLDLVQLEAGPPSTFTASSRSAEIVRDTASAAGMSGRVQIDVPIWCPDISAADAVTWGRTEMVIAWIDENNFIAVDTARRQVRVVVDGVRSILPGVLPAWSANDVLTFSIAPIGDSSPKGTYTYNGARGSLGTGQALPALRTEDDTVLSWFARGTTSATATDQLQGLVDFAAYAYGSAAAPRFTFYASVSGGGSAAGTVGDPASLDRALTLARAHLPGPDGSVRIVLRGGTYYLSAAIALTDADNGLEIVNYPGEVPVLSGGTLVTGWADDGTGQGVYSATLAHATRDLWVGGTRCNIARSAQITPAAWATTVTGFTAPDATIAGYARPSDVELVGAVSFKKYIVRVASASGTTITASEPDWGNANSQSFYPFDENALIYWQNARELIDGTAGTKGYWYRNAGTSTLYYKPRNGETMNTTPAVAGHLEALLTITGTADTVARVTLRGITFAHSTWNEPTTQGYASIQSVIVGTTGNSPTTNVGHKVPGAVRLQYATSTITGCTFAHLGACGIALETGTQGSRVTGCTFADIASADITVGDASTSADWAPAASSDRVRSNTLSDNVHGGGAVVYWDAPSVFVGYSSDNVIEHNAFTQKSVCDIAVGWGWRLITAIPSDVLGANEIRYNKISGARRLIPGTSARYMQDFGSIYFAGAMPSTTATANDVYSDTYDLGGIYLDSSSGVTATGNVVRGLCATAFFCQPAAPQAVNSTIDGNYYSTPDASNAGIDPSVVFSNNTASIAGAAAQSIILAAGRR